MSYMRDNTIVVLDFDGTIVDVWDRYYSVFIAASGTEVPITKLEYKKMKAQLIRDDFVAREFGVTLPCNYYKEKKELLECLDYLQLDQLLIERQRLIEFILSHECIVLTKRNEPGRFYDEIDYLNLSEISSKCIVMKPLINDLKIDYCKRIYPNRRLVVVGDSDDEYKFSDEKVNHSYMVNTGLRRNDSFEKRENVHLIKDINEFIDNY